MASSFSLILDTTAPQVTFGNWSGQINGAPLIVEYTINEPEIVSATFVDSAGIRYGMAVEPTRLTLVLSSTTATGLGYVEVLARDSVLNQQTYTKSISLGLSFEIHELDRARWPVKLDNKPANKATLSQFKVHDFTFDPEIPSQKVISSDKLRYSLIVRDQEVI